MKFALVILFILNGSDLPANDTMASITTSGFVFEKKNFVPEQDLEILVIDNLDIPRWLK